MLIDQRSPQPKSANMNQYAIPYLKNPNNDIDCEIRTNSSNVCTPIKISNKRIDPNSDSKKSGVKTAN